MKRLTIFLVIVLILCGSSVYADEQKLIDFTELSADVDVGNKRMHAATMVDYRSQAGASYTEEEKDQMIVSLALGEWDVVLASSSRTVDNMRYSMTKEVDSRQFTKVLGVRIHFPSNDFNSWALIQPPFEIPAYQRPTKYEGGKVVNLTKEEIDQLNQQSGAVNGEPGYVSTNSKFDGMGIIKNVGLIKSIKVQVYGANYPHGLTLRFTNETGQIRDIFMDYLNFDGWKELVWNNPNYIEEVKNREIRKMPLYPQAYPFMKFIGFVIHRDGTSIGSDFVTYFKDVEVIYDRAIMTAETDIDDEETWGILNEREKARRAAEIKRVGNIQVLRFLEGKKKAIETFGTDETGTTEGEE